MTLPLVFVVGDSISMAYGPHLERMLAGRFAYARKTGSEPGLRNPKDPPEANGVDSPRVREYLEDRIAYGGFRPDVLLVNCGLHDIKTDCATRALQVPLDAYRTHVAAIAQLMRKAARVPLWVNTTHVDDDRHNSRGMEFDRHDRDVVQYNQVAAEIMTAAGVKIIDLNAFTQALGGDVYRDHVHFIDSVAAIQAAYLAGFLTAEAAK